MLVPFHKEVQAPRGFGIPASQSFQKQKFWRLIELKPSRPQSLSFASVSNWNRRENRSFFTCLCQVSRRGRSLLFLKVGGRADIIHFDVVGEFTEAVLPDLSRLFVRKDKVVEVDVNHVWSTTHSDGFLWIIIPMPLLQGWVEALENATNDEYNRNKWFNTRYLQNEVWSNECH